MSRQFACSSALVISLLCALTLLTQHAAADELYARVRGTVTDQTGAIVPEVALKITNIATGISKDTTSKVDGSFEFVNLPPGTYKITATKSGFSTFTISNITLLANQVYVPSIAMEVGTVTQEVVVMGNPAQVEQTSMQLTATIDAKTVTDLPLNGRNWVTLQQTLPGVVMPDTRFGTNYSTNGSQAQQNSYLINGTDYNDLPLNTPLAAPSPDAIGEVRMITNTINPEYGRNSGAILSSVIKSGTNSFHGDAFEFFRDTSLNTKNFFQIKPSKFHQHQYGGTIGGPILKNKTFFFFSLQNTRNAVPSTNVTGQTTVFTQAQLNGDFSDKAISTIRMNPFPITGENGTVYPAGTATWKTIFPTGHIPVADFNPLSASLVKQFVPLPNLSTNQFTWSPTNTGKVNQYLGRLDQNFGQNDSLWFYAFANNSTNLDDAPFTGSTLPGFGQESVPLTKQFTTAWAHTFNPNLLNEFRVGYTRLNFNTVQPQQVVQPSSVGFPNIIPQIASGAQYPRINITGYFNLGFSTNGPQPRKDQTYQITDNFSWIHGRHSFKFGYEGRKFQVWNPFGARNNGYFIFSNAALYGTGDPGLNFLLGIPTSYNQSSGSVIIARAYEHYMYFQDQWAIRHNLTLTLGTGYEIDTPIRELQNGGLARVCFIPGQVSTIYPTAPAGYDFPGDPGCNDSGGATIKYNHFGPRVGFAYTPDWGRLSGGPGKMSIRGGVGIYYDRGEEELNLQDLGDSPFGRQTGGIADNSTQTNPLAPGFPNPFVDIAGKGSPLANPFPFTPPAPGTPVNFTGVFPVSGGFSTIDPNFTIPRVTNFNLTVERELPGSTVLRVGYVGAVARHLVTSYTFNPVTPAGVADCLAIASCRNNPEGQPTNFPSHFLYGGTFGSAGQQHTNATSNYNSLQITVDKRFSHGLQFLSTYTWAHSLDEGSSFEDVAFLSNGGNDPYGRLGRDYGNSAFDTRHRFTLTASYDIPNINKLSVFTWMPSQIMGGWRIVGINALQTGQPILFQDSNDNSLTCAGAYSFYSCPDRPDLVFTPTVLDPHTASFKSLNHYFFDPSAFKDNALGTLGTLGRGTLHGPNFWNVDFALQKDTRIAGSERPYILQLRVEAFNLFNHTNFNNPVADFASGNFGRVTSILRNTNSRLWQLGAKFSF